MSGRGRSNHGGRNHRSGRGQGRGPARGGKSTSDKKSTTSTTTELKFVPHYSGKQQMVTYDTVKDHIVNHIQKTFKHGVDIARAI